LDAERDTGAAELEHSTFDIQRPSATCLIQLADMTLRENSSANAVAWSSVCAGRSTSGFGCQATVLLLHGLIGGKMKPAVRARADVAD